MKAKIAKYAVENGVKAAVVMFKPQVPDAFLMQRMGLSKRKATTKSPLSKYDFEEVREIFLNDVSSVVLMEDIPLSLIINWDQTGVVPVSQWTMEVKGARQVEIAGLSDKRQMTMVLAGTASD